MSIIYPGNFVARLNAYNGQGVEALPGVVFYSKIGYAAVTADITEASTAAVLLPKVLSPDMRGDDKPRLDKDLTVPEGAVIYRTAVQPVNLRSSSSAATGTITVTMAGAAGTTLANDLGAAAASEATTGNFAAAGAVSNFLLSTALSAQGSPGTTISAKYQDSASNDQVLEIIDTEQAAGVIVEVCYYLEATAPNVDDINIPFKTIAGSA